MKAVLCVRACVIIASMFCVQQVAAQELPLALNGMDPVLLTQGVEQAGSGELTGVDALYTYRFASEENRARFIEAKEQFRIQNEMCPVVPGVPGTSSLYAVHEGKIYIFATSGCIDAFKSSPESYLP